MSIRNADAKMPSLKEKLEAEALAAAEALRDKLEKEDEQVELVIKKKSKKHEK